MSEKKIVFDNDDGMHDVVMHVEDNNDRSKTQKVVYEHRFNDKLLNKHWQTNEIERNAEFENAKLPEHFKVASIDPYTIRKWELEGFYVGSPEKSGLTKEDYHRELLKRLELNPHLKTTNRKL